MIYVLDGFSQNIRVFRPDGVFSHTIGQKGKGPGEFVSAGAMAIGRGDTLWVIDGDGARYTAFDRSGRFLASYSRQVEGPTGGAFLPNGDYLDWDLGFPDEGPGVIGGARNLFYPIRTTEGFKPVRSLPPIVHTRRMIAIGSLMVPEVYFAPRLIFSIDSGGGIWFAHSQDYRIYRRTLEGDTTLVMSLAARGVPIGDTERAYIRNRVSRPDLRAAYIGALPEAKPIVHSILFSGPEHMLVIAEVAAVPEGMVVDVFRRSGHFVGRLLFPTHLSVVGSRLGPIVAFATADHLYVVSTDQFDVPHVSRLRIERRISQP